MKNYMLIGAFAFCLIFLSSCMKCYDCTNICYDCSYGAGTKIICSTDHYSMEAFNDTMDRYRSSPNQCIQIDSYSPNRQCGSSLSPTKLRISFEKQGYKCVVVKD